MLLQYNSDCYRHKTLQSQLYGEQHCKDMNSLRNHTHIPDGRGRQRLCLGQCRLKGYLHPRRIGIRPELSGQIAPHLKLQFVCSMWDEWQFVSDVDGPNALFLPRPRLPARQAKRLELSAGVSACGCRIVLTHNFLSHTFHQDFQFRTRSNISLE